jgi:hypothetical protein
MLPTCAKLLRPCTIEGDTAAIACMAQPCIGGHALCLRLSKYTHTGGVFTHLVTTTLFFHTALANQTPDAKVTDTTPLPDKARGFKWQSQSSLSQLLPTTLQS